MSPSVDVPACDVCGTSPAQHVRASSLGPVSYRFCHGCLEAGHEASWMIAASLGMLCRYLQRASTVASFHRSRLKDILGRATIDNGRVRRGYESAALQKHLDSPHPGRCPVAAALEGDVSPPETERHRKLHEWIRGLREIE